MVWLDEGSKEGVSKKLRRKDGSIKGAGKIDKKDFVFPLELLLSFIYKKVTRIFHHLVSLKVSAWNIQGSVL